MYSIIKVSEMTDIPSHTLRYYEKEGILPPAKRISEKNRVYSEQDVQFILFIKSLKTTGMSLGDIKEIVKDGCLKDMNINDKEGAIQQRKEILLKHLGKLEEQFRELERVISNTKHKIITYNRLLDGEKPK